jgi:phosphoglycolate phosphatase
MDASSSRPELPAVARARAEAFLGHEVAGANVIVIGDTPADMSCGNGIGARAIGVATGRYSVEQLTDCAEGVVFADLADTSAVIQAILGDAHA